MLERDGTYRDETKTSAEARQRNSLRSEHGEQDPPLHLRVRALTPLDAGGGDVDDGTKPLTLRRKDRLPRPTITIDPSDKENLLPITESDLMQRQSPLMRQTARLADANHFQIVDAPASRRPAKLKKKRVLSNPAGVAHVLEARSSSTFPSPVDAQRRSWLDTVFKFRPATYSLLSCFDVNTTRAEARRLLTEMDMLVALEDAEKLGVLKCRSQDVKDASNIMVALETVKFHVDLQWPVPSLCRDGYLVWAEYGQTDDFWILEYDLPNASESTSTLPYIYSFENDFLRS